MSTLSIPRSVSRGFFSSQYYYKVFLKWLNLKDRALGEFITALNYFRWYVKFFQLIDRKCIEKRNNTVATRPLWFGTLQLKMTELRKNADKLFFIVCRQTFSPRLRLLTSSATQWVYFVVKLTLSGDYLRFPVGLRSTCLPSSYVYKNTQWWHKQIILLSNGLFLYRNQSYYPYCFNHIFLFLRYCKTKWFHQNYNLINDQMISVTMHVIEEYYN